ncbi:hypothetical protein K502DRAFT_258304 [Neoconidiobolus thromboides FSU 785]|nr:hypothetical protein K502DRAFT_258304 [Neoconidiobolus thromboides FSU 785]
MKYLLVLALLVLYESVPLTGTSSSNSQGGGEQLLLGQNKFPVVNFGGSLLRGGKGDKGGNLGLNKLNGASPNGNLGINKIDGNGDDLLDIDVSIPKTVNRKIRYKKGSSRPRIIEDIEVDAAKDRKGPTEELDDFILPDELELPLSDLMPEDKEKKPEEEDSNMDIIKEPLRPIRDNENIKPVKDLVENPSPMPEAVDIKQKFPNPILVSEDRSPDPKPKEDKPKEDKPKEEDKSKEEDSTIDLIKEPSAPIKDSETLKPVKDLIEDPSPIPEIINIKQRFPDPVLMSEDMNSENKPKSETPPPAPQNIDTPQNTDTPPIPQDKKSSSTLENSNPSSQDSSLIPPLPILEKTRDTSLIPPFSKTLEPETKPKEDKPKDRKLDKPKGKSYRDEDNYYYEEDDYYN